MPRFPLTQFVLASFLALVLCSASGAASSTFRFGEPVIMTTYFYWYDGKKLNPNGTDALTDHPPTLNGFSYKDVSWHARQLEDMMAAGIDILLPVYYGSPETKPDDWTESGLLPLVKARTQLLQQGKNPPVIGMFYDTSTLGDNDGAIPKINLRTPAGRSWFYTSVHKFFLTIPKEHWATINGKPVIVIYNFASAKGVDFNLFPYVREHFRQDFGCVPFIVSPWPDEVRNILGLDEAQKCAVALGNAQDPLAVLGQIWGNDRLAKDDDIGAAGFVSMLYQNFLGRFPSNEEKFSWAKELRRKSQVGVATDFAHSEEAFRTMIARWCQKYFHYAQPLDRLKNSPLVIKWAFRLAKGEDYFSVLSSFLAQPAFYDECGRTDNGLVEALYQKLLFVEPDSEGKANWLAELRTRPRAQIIHDFLKSEEPLQIQVASWLLGEPDATYSWGGAMTPKLYDVVAIGPGYNDSAVQGRTPQVVSREGGAVYRNAWNSLLRMRSRPWLVHIETWNEYFEGTDIAESKEYGRQYINITRQYANSFHSLR